MQFNIKRTVGIAYIIAGFVWCILNLPNLMARAKGNAIFATGLSIIRILFWPFFIMLLVRGKKGDTALVEGDSDEETTVPAD